MSGTEHRAHPPVPNHPWLNCCVTCDRCGYRVDLIKSDWRCWFCGAAWPEPDMIMVAKWREYYSQ